jgi:hypothetical protein
MTTGNPFVMPGTGVPFNVLHAGPLPFNAGLSPFSVYAPNPYPAMMNPYTPANVPTNANPAAAIYSAAYGQGMMAASSAYAYQPGMGYGSGYGSGNSNPYTPGSGGATDTSMQKYDYKTWKAMRSATPQLLDTLGLPTAKGQLSWPLGLRMMAPAPEAEDLRQQINGLVQTLAYQVASGQVQSGTVEAATHATSELRRLWRKGQGSAAIAEQTARDANRFLDRLNTAIQSAASVNASYDDAQR